MAGDERVFVAGHNGLVGSALVRELTARGYGRLLTRTRSELDLRDQRAVADFFRKERPEVGLLAAAKVGGIHANNTDRWEFLKEQLLIPNHVLGNALDHEVAKVRFVSTSCLYPKLA